MATFTFKRAPEPKGLARVCAGPMPFAIKLNKQEVGSLSFAGRANMFTGAPALDKWEVRLKVVDGTGFKWITLTKKFERGEEDLAKDWLKEKCDAIIAKYDLYKR